MARHFIVFVYERERVSEAAVECATGLSPKTGLSPEGPGPEGTVALGQARLGITVTRKVGNAVRRNRIKRLVREWFRRAQPALGAYDVVVIAKRDFPADVAQPAVGRDLDRVVEAWRRGATTKANQNGG